METIKFETKSMQGQSGLDVDGAQRARRATGAPSTSRNNSGILMPPDPEVPEQKPRRRFSASYKLRILREYDSCSLPGEIGALLRREGLYHSHINTWSQQRDRGALQGLSPKKRGRKAKKSNPLAQEVARLERENKRLSIKLQQAETIIEVQKKISEILGIPQDSNGEQS